MSNEKFQKCMNYRLFIDHGYRNNVIDVIEKNKKYTCPHLTKEAFNADKTVMGIFLKHCADNNLEVTNNDLFVLIFMDCLCMYDIMRANFIKYSAGINQNKLEEILGKYGSCVVAPTDKLHGQEEFIILFLKKIIWPSPSVNN